MAKVQRGRGATTGTSDKQPRRGAVERRSGDSRSPDAWLTAVVFSTTEAKIPVNIRLDADIVRFFRAGGPGYHTRINEVLRAFVSARLQAGEVPGPQRKSAEGARKRAK
ncbi:MAG: BrnA antitoxin family protein [Rhodospirillales bacterium]